MIMILNKVKLISGLALSLFLMGAINACKKDDQATGTDKELYDMAKSSSGFTWYKNSSSLLAKSSGSGHSQPLLRTRYNVVAATKLDSSGKIMDSISFPEGSLIVKDLFDDSSTLGRYAVLYKNSSSAEADAKGWVWGYINSDGSVAEPASNKGSACKGCHSQSGNIDYMLMNKFFP
jgi:hypothetical protein